MTLRSTPAAALLAILAVLPSVAQAQKLEREEKKWFDNAHPLMLPDEEKTFRGLKDKADRLEFQKIFWARRDPDLDTPENEFQDEYAALYTEADNRYKVAGRGGAETDCGRTFILLGKPDDVKKDTGGINPGIRAPETWTYRDRPGQTFQGGRADISFDETCSFPAGGVMREQLNRVAQTRIAQPNIGYKFDKSGHLVKLADQLPKPSAAQALLKTPRTDFPVAAEVSYLKTQDGGTALTGLVRGDAAGFLTEDAGGKKMVKVVVGANATTPEGKTAAFAEEPTVAEVRDGHFVAAFRMGLKPGKYTLRAGALEEKSGKGSLTEMPVEVPDLNKGEMSAATLLVLQDVEELGTSPGDPRHPFADFTLGTTRLIPRFGGVFTKTEAVSFFFQVYDLMLDPATGKASGVASVAVLKEKGRAAVAKAGDQTIDSAVGGNVIGPVPLSTYDAGKYIVQLRVKDTVAKKDLTQEVFFEVR